MAFILNIETATSLCSVALARDGKVVAQRETSEEKAHASKLTAFIEEILGEQKVRISDLDAIAVGKGPGSYTGLRIGVSTAKGLCFGAEIPLIAVSTLHILFKQVMLTKATDKILSDSGVLFCPMIDARRMEVFSCIINQTGKEIEPVGAIIIDNHTFRNYLENNVVAFFGSGMEKCRELLAHENALFIFGISPHSSALSKLAEEKFHSRDFEDIAYFEPFYLKDFIATIPKKALKV